MENAIIIQTPQKTFLTAKNVLSMRMPDVMLVGNNLTTLALCLCCGGYWMNNMLLTIVDSYMKD